MEATEPFNYPLPVLAVWYLLPPLFLLLRNYNKSPLPTWASCVLFCLIGWGLILWATMLRFDYLYEYASFVPKEQEKEVLEEWAADGGPKMMALLGVGSIPSFILEYGGGYSESFLSFVTESQKHESPYAALNWDRHLPGEHPLQSIKIRLK
jgi:hypothetical protein